MSITTMEQLEAVPVGDVVSVSDAQWERVTEGYRRGTYVIPTATMAGDLNRGNITRGARPQMGQLWENNGWFYVLCNQSREDVTVWQSVRCYNDGTVYSITDFTPSADGNRLVTDEQEWFGEQMRSACYLACSQAREMDRLREMERTQVDPERSKRLFVDEITAKLQSLLDGGEYDLSEVVEFLCEHGVESPSSTETLTVAVEIDGHTQVGIDSDDSVVNQWVPSGVRVHNVDSFEVDWNYTIEVQRTVNEGDCACDEVGYDDVTQLLRDRDMEWSRMDYSLSCSNC